MKRRETTDVSQISRRIHLVASSIHFGVQFSIIKILGGGCLGGQCGMIVKGLEGPSSQQWPENDCGKPLGPSK